jgi:hypothetical protein
MKLIYDGSGKHITGIPARDLEQADIDRLIASGLFVSETELITALTRKLYSVDKPVKTQAKPKPTEPDESEITE